MTEILKETQALLEGHFLLSSGKHSNRYVQCAKLLQYPDLSQRVLKIVCDKLSNIEFKTVVGPAIGGIIVAYEIARQLEKKAIFTERENNIMTLRRGFEIKKGEKVIITEDVITTGKSSYETIEVIKALGGEVMGLACIIDRSNGEFKIPLYSSMKLEIQTWEKEDCPLCKKGISIEKPGSRIIK